MLLITRNERPFTPYAQAVHDELAAHSSMLHVFSSGNNAANLDASVPSALNYPAADSATLPNMLVVGAVGFIGTPSGVFFNSERGGGAVVAGQHSWLCVADSAIILSIRSIRTVLSWSIGWV